MGMLACLQLWRQLVWFPPGIPFSEWPGIKETTSSPQGHSEFQLHSGCAFLSLRHRQELGASHPQIGVLSGVLGWTAFSVTPTG